MEAAPSADDPQLRCIFIILLCEAQTADSHGGWARLKGSSNPNSSSMKTFPFVLFLSVMASPQRFLGNSLLQWNNMAAVASSVPWHVELMLRTRQPSAILLHISSGLQHNLTLQVRSPTLTPRKSVVI